MCNDIVVYASLSQDRQKFTWLCPKSNIYGEIKIADYSATLFPKSVNNFNLIEVLVTDHRFLVQSPNPDKTEFYLDFSIAYEAKFPPIVEKPKPIEEYSHFMVQYRTTYTSEYMTRIFTDFKTAEDFFLQSKAEMIDDARSSADYEIQVDTAHELCMDYEDRYQTISLEGIDLSDADSELKRSFFKS